ncbi:hypothetical protein GLOIN_2v1571206 [Rhizophagus irregularis DAOM 181602=DAOM 197198]|uniref:Uncharacterized protein n=1 Tax=Rhizophagus irregularis (strain DAOM 181602 / DAOM 197198 / MUCL 43194) TaxID=747089 RepID=A0A2P4QBA5_RHIID|nr:hypothetical protein GLOIN_2v1571206 [Rhizophagus irregularis DAOM 181602=DAOM 197198]POG74922.1 hypothetical protein GLOIN_2v1571206 [Rhizophagus irregularis DAOM 181602=DAOM 197198]|eukprot:XP_025181788.1 hypothetical protein GLOIN_2v1571206 [Rhizophagus irregularis DAOM 181602=DAOM 197198]
MILFNLKKNARYYLYSFSHKIMLTQNAISSSLAFRRIFISKKSCILDFIAVFHFLIFSITSFNF